MEASTNGVGSGRSLRERRGKNPRYSPSLYEYEEFEEYEEYEPKAKTEKKSRKRKVVSKRVKTDNECAADFDLSNTCPNLREGAQERHSKYREWDVAYICDMTGMGNRELTQRERGDILEKDIVGRFNWNPPYQRDDVWQPARIQEFFRSVIMGFATSNGLCCNERRSSGGQIYDVVDGRNRLRSLLKLFIGDVGIKDDNNNTFYLTSANRAPTVPPWVEKRILSFTMNVLILEDWNEQDCKQVFAVQNEQVNLTQGERLNSSISKAQQFCNGELLDSLQPSLKDLGISIKRKKNLFFASRVCFLWTEGTIPIFSRLIRWSQEIKDFTPLEKEELLQSSRTMRDMIKYARGATDAKVLKGTSADAFTFAFIVAVVCGKVPKKLQEMTSLGITAKEIAKIYGRFLMHFAQHETLLRKGNDDKYISTMVPEFRKLFEKYRMTFQTNPNSLTKITERYDLCIQYWYSISKNAKPCSRSESPRE